MKLFIKLVLEFSPLLVFFIASTHTDVYTGSAILVVATAISMAIMWIKFRRIAAMALITMITGIVSGAMTAYFVNEVFVKLKPTIVSLAFAIILLIGQMMDKPLLKKLLDEDLNLSSEGWRAISWRWLWYFIFIAFLNEFLWRNFSTEFWLAFKVFGLTPMTILYGLAQLPMLSRYKARPGPGPLDGMLSFGFPSPAPAKQESTAIKKPSPGST